jgi:hypothetical protein
MAASTLALLLFLAPSQHQDPDLGKSSSVIFLRPSNNEVVRGVPTVIEFKVEHGVLENGAVVAFQLDGSDEGYRCDQSHMTITLDDLSEGKHTASVKIGNFPAAVLTFWQDGPLDGDIGDVMYTKFKEGQLSLRNLDGGLHAKPHMTIKVLTFNRPASFQRVLRSLQRAEYNGDSVDLDIFIDTRDYSLDEMEVLQLANNFSWPHGTKRIQKRIQNAGLIGQWLEAWYPTSLQEFAFFAEDDIEVSPFFYTWIMKAIAAYYTPYSKRADRRGGAHSEHEPRGKSDKSTRGSRSSSTSNSSGGSGGDGTADTSSSIYGLCLQRQYLIPTAYPKTLDAHFSSGLPFGRPFL